MKFFKRNKKNVGVAGNANMSISSSDSVPATIPSGDSNVKIGSRGSIASSTNSLSGSSYSSYLYPHIKEKNLKDIFKAVWTENFIQTKNILAKSKNKAANAVDNENRTPLHLACAKGHQPILQQLLLSHPKINPRDNEGATPLIKAVQCQSDLCCNILLSYKPDVDIVDKKGRGALHYATLMGWEEGVRLLLRAKADVAIPDSNGNTALHLACLADPPSREIANLLMTFRAPVDEQNNKKETALIISAEKGDERLVQLLVEGGHADTTLKVEDGWTALDKAQMNGFHSIVQYLQNKEDEMRRSMGVPSVGGTLRDENDNGGDVIPIKSNEVMAMDIDTDEDEVDTSDAENKPGPSSEQPVPAPAPPPPDEPWISTDEEDDKAHDPPEPNKRTTGKLGLPKREMNSDSISLLLPAATDDQKTESLLDADSKRDKFSVKATGNTTVADVYDFGKSFSDDESSLGLGLAKNRPKTAVGSNRRQEENTIKSKTGWKDDSEWYSDNQDNHKPSAKPRESRNWNHNDDSGDDEFDKDGKSKADVTDVNASVISWSLDEKPQSNGNKLTSTKEIDPKSSYWDSSEDETQAQEELEKLRHVGSPFKQPSSGRPGIESSTNHFDSDSDEDGVGVEEKVASSKESVKHSSDNDVKTGSDDVRADCNDVINESNDVIASHHDTSEDVHKGHLHAVEKQVESQSDPRGQDRGLKEVTNEAIDDKVNYTSDDDDSENWDSDNDKDNELPLAEKEQNGIETKVQSGEIEVPILQDSHNSSDLNILEQSSNKEDDEVDKVGSPFDSETESEQPKAGNGVADSFKNRIDKVDQSKGDIAIMQASSNNNGVKVKPEISGESDSNFDKESVVENGRRSESSGEENGMMVNIIGARQAKSSGFAPKLDEEPKFGVRVFKSDDKKAVPEVKPIVDPVTSDDESSQAEPTEPTSSWEIENRNRRLQKQLSTKKEEAEKKEELPAEEDVIDETYDPILHLNAAPEVDNSFDVSNTDFDEDEEEVDGGAAADSTPRGVIYPSSGPDSKFLPAGGGDRIPSTPVPSKNATAPDKTTNYETTKFEKEVPVIEKAGLGVEETRGKEKSVEDVARKGEGEQVKKEGDDDGDDSSGSDNLGPPTLSIGYSPRLADITNNVSSLAGSVAIKNQFREQGRLIAQEQVEKQRMERKMKAFESEVDALSNKIHQLQKEKELTEEDEVRLKNDLKSLQQQLVDEQENRQLSEQVSAQRSNQVDKLESELERETAAKEDAERSCRQLQKQLKELNNKLKNIESRPTTKLGSRRGSGSFGNVGSLPRNLLLLDETQAPEIEADDIIPTVEEAVAVQSVPSDLHAAAASNLLPHMKPVEDVRDSDFISITEKNLIEEKHEKEVGDLKDRMAEMESQLEDLKEEKNRITEDLAAEKLSKEKLILQLDAEKARNVDSHERADEKIRELKEKVEEKENFVKQLQGELKAKDAQISELQEKIHSKEVLNTKLQANLDHTEQVVKAEKELLHQSNAEKLKLQSEVKQQQESMNEMYQTSIDYKRDLALAEARIKANEDARRSNETEKEDLRNKLESLRQQLENSMQKQSETEVKNSELSVKLSMLEREKEAEPDVEEKERAHTKDDKNASRPEKKSKAEEPKQDHVRIQPGDRTRDVNQIIEEHRKQVLESSQPPSNWFKNNDRYIVEESPISMAHPYNNTLMAENIPYKLDGIQNELDRERQHRLNSEIDNRQLKYETNQAYADQTTLNKRLEALEKRIEEHVSHGVGVPLGATVPPAPKNMYPPSGSGAPFDPPNYGIDLERFKKDIEAQCRMELIEQQQKVNNYLDEQIHMRSNFEKARAEQENALKQEYNRRISDLELEIRKYKDLYGVTIPVRDPGTMVGAGSGAMASLGEDPELKRLHTLLEKERRQREKLESRLDRMVDRDIENRAQIAVEKQRMNDLTSSSGLGTLGLGSQSGHVSEFDALLEKVRRQLDNSISRHLGTTKMELEMFSQHPYATRDRSFNIPNSSRLSNFNSSYKF